MCGSFEHMSGNAIHSTGLFHLKVMQEIKYLLLTAQEVFWALTRNAVRNVVFT